MNGKNHHRDELHCSKDDAKEFINFVETAHWQQQQKKPATFANHSCLGGGAESRTASPSSVCETYDEMHPMQSDDDGTLSDHHDSSTPSSLDESKAALVAARRKKPVHDQRHIAFSRSLQRHKLSRDQVGTTATGRAFHSIKDDNDAVAPSHDSGFFQMVLEQRMTGEPGAMTNVVPSSDVIDTSHFSSNNSNSNHVNIENSQSMTAMMAKTDSVFFGWIRHPATKTWRDAVKVFSRNRREFPSWSDDICDKLKVLLRDEKKIERFFICRRNKNDNNTNADGENADNKQKRIFDKQKNYMGEWAPATDQEILDRTKQRFVDDRKPHATAVAGAKRPRGRPPKTISRESSLELANPQSTTAVLMTLHPLLMKCNHDLMRLEAAEKHEKAAAKGNDDPANKSVSSTPFPDSVTSEMPIDPAKLFEMMSDLDRTQMLVRKELESALRQSKASEDIFKRGTSDAGENPAKKPKLNHEDLSVPNRQPWFPVMSYHVCFGWNHHAGTIKWRDVVKTFSGNLQSYPVWSSEIADLVKVKLAEKGCSVFLVFLDAQEKPSQSIHDGLWYSATDNEFEKHTRDQFLKDRSQ